MDRFGLFCFAFCLFASLPAFGADQVRVWTSDDGRELQAALLEVSDAGVLLRLENGREALVPLSRLSSADREFLEAIRSQPRAYVAGILPAETNAEEEIEVTGGPDRYLTPHFSFESTEPVSKAFISEASRIYEGTFAALNAIPHGLQFSPPEGSTHFRGSFMDYRSFNQIADERMGSIPGQRVVGLYLGDEQRLLVPFTSLGAKRLGSRLTLRKSSDTTTLVHEIVHQVMHRYLPVLPTWFSEGMAEYISAVPYQNGRFEFRNAERGLKERLKDEYRSSGRTIESVIRPSAWMASVEVGRKLESESGAATGMEKFTLGGLAAEESSGSRRWSGRVEEYRDALLLVYFFMHLDEPEAEGRPVGEFLNVTNQALGETESIVEEMKQFEEDRLSYNDDVQRFNQSIEAFQAAVDAYNQRIATYNQQLRDGVASEDRIEVGEPPEEPVRPESLEVPERLQRLTADGGLIDLAAMVENRALSVLVDGRPLARIDERMQAQFESIGIKIEYRQ